MAADASGGGASARNVIIPIYLSLTIHSVKFCTVVVAAAAAALAAP